MSYLLIISIDLYSTYCGQCEKTIKCLLFNIEFLEVIEYVRNIHDKIKDKQGPKCAYNTYSNSNMRHHVTRVHNKAVMN